ncbi:dihydropteroate synthase, partial [bacterium]|nr:dihydropteroate synthase [bacterium]
MEIIGERINTSRKHIHKAVSERDKAYIQEQVRMQDKAGADYIDVNAGTSVSAEIGDLEWLMDIVQEVTDKPLCIDSANPKAIEAALKRNKNGVPIVNSITGEKNRIDNILPLVKEYNTKVVALTMDDSGMPENLEKRVDIAKKLADRL